MRFILTALLGLVWLILTHTPCLAEKRIALIVGNSEYLHTTMLSNPTRDADAIAAKLKGIGYEVILGTNLTNTKFRLILRQFSEKLQTASTGVFFYAGHGLQANGRNYLVPIDANIKIAADLRWQTVEMQDILDEMQHHNRTSIILLDACRDNPLSRTLARALKSRSGRVGRGLARITAGSGTFVGFATAPGEVALDGSGDNSPFTKALIKHIDSYGQDISVMMRRVRAEVMQSTNLQQVPWSNSSLWQDFQFNPNNKDKGFTANLTKKLKSNNNIDEVRTGKSSIIDDWTETQNIGTCGAYEAFEESHKGTFRARLAREWRKKNCSKQLLGALPETKRENMLPPSSTDQEELKRSLQKELKRVGCYSGPIDGDWGKLSQIALSRFNQQNKGVISLEILNKKTLEILRSQKTNICSGNEQNKGKGKKKRIYLFTNKSGTRFYIGDNICYFGSCATATQRRWTYCAYCKAGNRKKCIQRQYHRPRSYTCGKARARCQNLFGRCQFLKSK